MGLLWIKKTAKMMVEKETYLISTCSVMGGAVNQANEGLLNEESSKNAYEADRVHKDNMIITYEEGVKMLMGTDSGVSPHGNNLGKLKSLCDVGLNPLESIASGTIEAAKALEIDNEVGSIEVGKSADMIMVPKNPLEDIEHLADPNNILTVIQDGDILKDLR